MKKILIFGAGVIGSLYAAKLDKAGYDVSILARGQRLADLQQNGIVLTNAFNGERTVRYVKVVEKLGFDERYDLVIVPIRREQLSQALPVLAANKNIPSFLFMICNPLGPEEMINALGRDRVLLGYAGAGGQRVGSSIQYAIVPPLLQRTMLGELNGRKTERVQDIARAFQRAGFPVEISPNMDAWIKSHVAWITPLVKAFSLYGGDNFKLAGDYPTVKLMVSVIRENFKALCALGFRVEGPLWVKLHPCITETILAKVWQVVLNTELARISMAEHARVAAEEMQIVTSDLQSLVLRANTPTPASNQLYALQERNNRDR